MPKKKTTAKTKTKAKKAKKAAIQNPDGKYDQSGYLVGRIIDGYMKPHVGKFIVATFCMILVAGSTAANAWLMQPMLDDIFLEKNELMLMIVPIVVLALAIIKGVSTYAQAVIMKSVGQRIVTDMQLQLYDHLLHADLAELSSHHSGKLVSRFTNDITIMKRSVSNVLTGFAKEILTLIFLVGVMFYQSVVLSFIALFVFPIAIQPIVKLGKRMRKISHSTQVEMGAFTSKLDETFRGIRLIKAYRREDYETKRAGTIMENLYRLYVKAARTESLASPIMETLGGIAIAAIIWYGGFQVLEGKTTPGSFFSFITAMIMAYKPMKSISGLNTALQEGLAAGKRLFILLDQKPVIEEHAEAKTLQFKKADIHFDHVTFHYETNKRALKDISLDFAAGKMTALVGASGSGKSTVMNLLLRFYDPEKGKITIDGADIKECSLESLRDHIALVSQETVLFDDTIYANIAYGKPKATKEDIEKAAKLADAEGFIAELPEGYNTRVGQNGFSLSGGQRQRIAIARALLKDAPILLLDEATSALDTLSEQQVQKALNRLMKGRTTIVIAHRLSTVMNANRIYVLKGGKVTESGTHQELLKSKGHYQKLYKVLEQ